MKVLFRTVIGVSIEATDQIEAQEIAKMLAKILTADPRVTWADADDPEVLPADYDGTY